MRQIATAPGTCDPAWSPRGERVAVVAPDGLWVLSSDLRTTTHLVHARNTVETVNTLAHRRISQPRWSPDASALAFLLTSNGTSWVEVTDTLTGKMLYLSGPETDEFVWGTDSRSLCFDSRVVGFP